MSGKKPPADLTNHPVSKQTAYIVGFAACRTLTTNPVLLLIICFRKRLERIRLEEKARV